MIDTVLFDMGGTLEDIRVDDESRRASIQGVLDIHHAHGIDLNMDFEAVRQVVTAGWDRYAVYRDPRQRELKPGVISNTASLYQVFDILGEYGIRDYFQDVTLSSVTGYRKPDPNIFLVSLKQIRSEPANCAYVGDTISRDVIGPIRMGFGATFHIDSYLTRLKDTNVPPDVHPTYSVQDIYEVYTILKEQC